MGLAAVIGYATLRRVEVANLVRITEATRIGRGARSPQQPRATPLREETRA
jgi:hypothetical protein